MSSQGIIIDAGQEVRDPGRNVPRALINGMVLVIVVYGMANLAYFYALPFREIATSNSLLYPDALPVATKAAQTFIGTLGTKLVTTAFLLSIMGGLQGVIMVYARIPFAMALHGLFLSTMGTVSKGTSAPVWAIGIQAGWACAMAILGSFDQLTDFVLFAAWVFYGLTAASVFVLRLKMPNAVRPYRTLGYPVVPLIFVLTAIWLVINTLQSNPVGSTIGLLPTRHTSIGLFSSQTEEANNKRMCELNSVASVGLLTEVAQTSKRP